MVNIVKAKKYGKIAFRKISSGLAGGIYRRTGFLIPKPTKLYYLITNQCNFRCPMCPQWQAGRLEKPEEYISEGRVKELIKEMTKLKIQEFGISGGEPLIYKDKVLRLLKYANEQGLYSHLTTNGSLLTKEFIKLYNDFGGGHISLSLDAIGGKHDELRGSAGAFDGAIGVISNFKKYKYKNVVLKINITLTNENLGEIMKILTLAHEVGAVAFIQPIDVYDYGARDVNSWEENNRLWVKKENYGELKRLIDQLIKFKNENPAGLLNSAEHLKSFYDYFTKNGFRTACTAPLDQITINPFGKAILCKFGEIVSLKEHSLREYLKSDKRKNIIESARRCRQGCLLGCMFKPGLGDLIKSGSRQFLKLIK